MKYYLLIIYLILYFNHAEADQSFTNLNAYACTGHERAGKFHCLPYEWMVSIETIPHNSEGFYQEGEVETLTVRLEKINKEFEADVYRIIPTMPTSSKVRWILRRYMVQGYFNGPMTLVPHGGYYQ